VATPEPRPGPTSQICGLTGTLICDEDGLYDPRDFNDRMLLGMKGQLSEAELHFLRSRMRGGILSKARRGELITPLPIGLAYDAAGHAGPDPDTSIQQAVTHLFTTFAATGSAHAVVKAFNDAGLLFPRRHRKGPRKGELDWAPLAHSAVLRILHNPRYAGVFCFGRHRDRADGDGTYIRQIKPREEWISFIPGAHPGYITVDEFEANQTRLAECAAAHGTDRTKGPPREGPALLQGIIICGRCGNRDDRALPRPPRPRAPRLRMPASHGRARRPDLPGPSRGKPGRSDRPADDRHPGPLSRNTATRECAGAMHNACRWCGDLPPRGVHETAMLPAQKSAERYSVLLKSGTRSLWGFRTRPSVLTWASMRPARIR
jgi:hypothetical protein